MYANSIFITLTWHNSTCVWTKRIRKSSTAMKVMSRASAKFWLRTTDATWRQLLSPTR